MGESQSLRERLRENLRDREYRHGYADEALDLFLASQIRVLREQRGLSQDALAELIGTKQSGISRLESANYSSWTIKILKRIAEAFDLRLKVSFEPFGTLWQEVLTRNQEHLQRPNFEEDVEFQSAAAIPPESNMLPVGWAEESNLGLAGKRTIMRRRGGPWKSPLQKKILTGQQILTESTIWVTALKGKKSHARRQKRL